ncbi:hypothetical protein ACJIZ3_004822 [Penstemon smallii]|uniref:VQ domain-containing protein n=1 Tax=Penstemon smallii TaxID=265156 RepID=A0ABD3S3F2_9LAMI
MDSCNSGSLQSSSGGDEEFDSRAAAAAAADSFSAFLNTQQPHNAGPISNPSPPLFDPLLSNYFQLQQNPNMPWPRPTTLRSDPNQNPMLYQQTFLPSFQSQPPAVGPDNNVNNNSNLTDVPPAPQNQNQAAARNPKKRSRASRRAPTTVLTTDTTNFRAMVQEFTGIPAPPFNNSSLFPRNRLDLFGNITRSTSFDAAGTPPYLRRPLPQKVQSPPPPPQPPFLGSSLNATSASSNINNNNNNTVATNSVSSTPSSVSISNADFSNYQIPITQNSNVFNFPNPFITSLLQNNSKFPFSNSSHHHVSSFGNIPLNDNHLNEFGLGHHENRVNPTLPNLISSDQIAPRNNNNANANANEGGERDGEAQIRSGNENNYNFLRNIMSDGKIMNFEGDDQKRQESNTRGDQAGTVESWICSSSD